MSAFERQLQAVEGYLELGMAAEAHAELATLEPVHQADLRVAALRIWTCQSLHRWEEMQTLAAHLCVQRPDEAQWSISLAYATRRAQSLPVAREVLQAALVRFPQEPMISFNLACYECQLGHLPEARRHLEQACRLNAACRQLALADEDLAPLHGELRAEA